MMIAFALLCVMLPCSVLAAHQSEHAEPGKAAQESASLGDPSDARTDLALLDALDDMMLSANYADVRLHELTADLSGRLGVPVLLDPDPLRTIGVREDARVTLHTGQIPASALLDSLMRELAAGLDRPVWEAHAGTVVLTSQKGTEALRSLVVYDVRDLVSDDGLMREIQASRPAIEAPALDDEAAEEHTDDDTRAEKKGEGDIPEVESGHDVSRSRELLMIIMEHIDPDAWIDMGGSRATVTDHNGVVIVTACASLHRRIRSALTRLRAIQAHALRIGVYVIDLDRSAFEALGKSFPHEGSLAVALLRHPQTLVRWQSQGTVAVGSALELHSASENSEVSVSVRATFDRPSGRLRADIRAMTAHGADKRSAETSVQFQLGESAAIIELAAAEPTETVRVVIVRPM